MDSDANLPDSSSDEDEFAVGEIEGEEGAAGEGSDAEGSTKPVNLKR